MGKIDSKRSFLSYAFIFCFVNLFLINGALMVIGQDQSLVSYVSDTLLAHPTYSDSWDPMYRGLVVFRSGEDPTIYQKVFFDQKHKFQYPPTSLLIIDIVRLGISSQEPIITILNWISWISVLGTVFFTVLIFREGLRRYVPEEYSRGKWKSILLVVVLGFTYYPILRGFMLGQIQTWLNFLFSISLWFWIQKQKGKSGFFLGLISVIKPQMGLFIFWGFIRKQWKFCLSLGGIAAVILITSLWRYGLAAHLKYLEVLKFIGSRGEAYFPNQSINGLLNRMLFNGNNLDWETFNFAPPNDVVQTVTIITSALLILWVFVFNKKVPEIDSWLGFVTAGLIFTAASPVAWEHHYGILLPVFALVFPKVWSLRQKLQGGVIWVSLAYILTANYFYVVQLTATTHWNILQSYVFFGAMILLVVLIKIQLLEAKELQSVNPDGENLKE